MLHLPWLGGYIPPGHKCWKQYHMASLLPRQILHFQNQFVYDDSNAAVVTGITPSHQASIKAGTQITITGNNFGTEEGTVATCTEATILTWNDTEIVITLPQCDPSFTYPLLVFVEGCGYADLM